MTRAAMMIAVVMMVSAGVARAAQETIKPAPVSPVQGGKKMPSTPGAGQEKVDVAPTSPIQGGQVIPSTAPTAADLKEGQHVQVTYHSVDGKLHATRVKVM